MLHLVAVHNYRDNHHEMEHVAFRGNLKLLQNVQFAGFNYYSNYWEIQHSTRCLRILRRL